MSRQRLAWVLAVVVLAGGCSGMRQILGVPALSEPSVAIKSAETRWLLVKNPRFGDVPSEPEYIWVEEDNVPTTLATLIRGKSAIIAPPEIVAKYGSPPGGGKLSPRQGMPYQAADASRPSGVVTTVRPAPRPGVAGNGAALPAVPETPQRGLVVYVDTTRIVVDLTAADGLRPGSLVSLRRDRIPIVHPVTGEVLGELDEEVATARVVETRAKFSVAEIQTVAAGLTIQVKDRVVPK